MEYSHPFANQDFRHLEMHTMGAICGFGYLFSQCTFFGFVFLMLNMNNFSHWKNFLWISHTHFIGLINMTKKQNSITKKRHDGSKWTLPICINWNVVFRKKLVVLLFFFLFGIEPKSFMCFILFKLCISYNMFTRDKTNFLLYRWLITKTKMWCSKGPTWRVCLMVNITKPNKTDKKK